eukprot:NODE_12649_length_1212_cov_3.046083.p1 GENE.NODE_12649_length_1212_cov_3.046083~~NODE_12649_length_1212_cov_3.046083.p1  ORF type:complete len:229 (-),score=39.30 NODE_12649_length_1212_cov_3.046083:454-1140(-)
MCRRDGVDALCSSRDGDAGKSESSSQLLAEFLAPMDGCGPSTEGILILAATNRPWALDRAILSRFQKKIYVPLPEYGQRAEQMSIGVKGNRSHLTDQDYAAITRVTENFSARDITSLVQGALAACLAEFQGATKWRCFRPHPFDPTLDYAYEPVIPGMPPPDAGTETIRVDDVTLDALTQNPDMTARTVLPCLLVRHFLKAAESCKATVSNDDLTEFQEWTQKFGMSA